MPRLRQYVSQEATNNRGFATSRTQMQGIDVSGLVKGAFAVEEGFERQAHALKIIQEKQAHDRKQLELDEARMHVTNTMSEAAVQWRERLTAMQEQAPADAAGFTQSTLKEYDAWSETKLKEAPTEPAKKLLTEKLLAQRVNLHANAFEFEVTQRRAALLQEYGDGLQADRKAVMAEPGQYQERAAQRIALAETLNLPVKAKAELIDKTKEALAYDAASGLIDQSPAGFLERAGMRASKGLKGKVGSREPSAAEKVASDPILSALSPEKMRALLDRASGLVAQQEAAAAMAKDRADTLAYREAERKGREAAESFSILSKYTDSGRLPDMSDTMVQLHMKRIENTPYAEHYRKELENVPNRQAVSLLPIQQQEVELDQLMTRRNVQGASPGLEAEIKRRETILKQQKEDFKKEPLRAAVEYGLYSHTQPLDMTSIDTIVNGLPHRGPQASAASRQTGQPVSPLLTHEAHTVADKINAAPANIQATMVAKLASAMTEPEAHALARQIGPKDRALELAFKFGASKTDSGRLVSEHLLRGRAYNAERKIDDGKGDSIQQALRNEIISVIDGPDASQSTISGQWRKDVIDSAMLISAGLNAGGFKQGADRAVRLAIGGDLINFNGKRIPVPAGDGIDTLRDRLSSYPVEDLKRQAPDGQIIVAGRVIEAEQFAQQLPNSVLTPAGEGRYYVNTGAGIAMNTKGKPLIVSIR